MGRFGIRSDGGHWETPVSGVRPLLTSDRNRTAAALGAIIAVSAIPTSSPLWLAPWIMALPLVLVAVARVPVRHWVSRVAAVVPFGILAVLFAPWTMGGPHREFAGLSLSVPGIHLAIFVLVKLVAVALLLSYLVATTPVVRLLGALRDLCVPALLVDILESTIRYLAILVGEARQMLLSCRLRSSGPPVVRRTTLARFQGHFSRAASLVAGLFIRTLKRAERCASARASRERPDDRDPGRGGETAPSADKDEILVEGLCHTYPGSDAPALSGVTLNIPRGKRIALLGANGAGKTTLLLHLNGVLLATSGRVSVGGLEVNRSHLATIRRRVGMVFQNPDDQVFSATVLQDVRYGPEQAGHGEADCARLAESALRSVGLWTLRDRAPFSLSQGQRKRAAIAGVLAAGSEILLFDEPMASLDPAGKDEILVLLNDLHHSGKTLVVATHDVDFAAAWSDGVILMSAGQVVSMGAPDLLVNETVMAHAGLALPLVSRPFDLLRPHLKRGNLGLERLPANIAEAFAWLHYHFVEKDKRRTTAAGVRDRDAPMTVSEELDSL